MRKLFLACLVAAGFAACISVGGPVKPPAPPFDHAAAERTCREIWREELSRDEVDADCVEQLRRGKSAEAVRAGVRQSPEWHQKHDHFDPTALSLGELGAMRGAMWTLPMDVPFGPRPGAADNAVGFPFFGLYAPDDRGRILAAYKAAGYNTIAIGPVAGTDCYHGMWPCHDRGNPGWWPEDDVPSQEQWDYFLDRVQEVYDAGLRVQYFHKPDNWEKPEFAARFAALDELARQPRAQRLLRNVIFAGWEPSGDKYGWSNATWVAMLQRGAQVFPNALRGLHTPCDLDAPTGQNDDQVLGPNGNAVAWRNAAPYIHYWALQVCGYVDRGLDDEFRREWPAAIQRAVKGFHDGYGGWPKGSAFGPDVPMLVIAEEYASYRFVWKRSPVSEALAIGDMAVAAGADGYMDGGTRPVEARR